MTSRYSKLPPTTPEIHETAAAIGRTCRIVVQALVPPELCAETERRFYLTARGVLEERAWSTSSETTIKEPRQDP